MSDSQPSIYLDGGRREVAKLLRHSPVMSPEDCSLDDFRALVEVETDPADYPLADGVEYGAVVYDMGRLDGRVGRPTRSVPLRTEIARALSTGPGIVLLRGGFDTDVVDGASAGLWDIIDRERRSSGAVGDHFAKAGANERVWNALEKLARHDPEAYVDYYANEALALGSLAWLGPGYGMTSQVNVVNPGGEAQVPHRDYHLGFMSDERSSEYPLHAHRLSPVLTLQGAVAHCDMPVETGPTMYLPRSQQYELGYLAWRRPDFARYFAEHHVQVPLVKGDVVFFNPALFHGAGHNRTADVRRMANLLQVSSAMGVALEAVDRTAMVLAVYRTMLERLSTGTDPELIGHAAAATAQGYAFPIDLDRDQPVGGLTPPSQLDVLVDGLERGVDPAEFAEVLNAFVADRIIH